FVDLFHRSLDAFGQSAQPVGVHSPGHIADTDQQAWEELYPAMEANRNAIGAERGWPPYSRLQFQHDVGPEGAIYAGSPETVARKIADTVRVLDLDRFDLKYANGTLTHEQMMRSIELYGTQVIPRVRELLAA
ncbi:MAG: LLM class flavin-dependent oxidoreductase, partial [Candidatus Cloacimonetes bacterium]|nr:LLM class flavin-dependent oxidoreductase [Candidatus Cloacimonadota bacterium]